ncbi:MULTISPECIES: hypothetical protein [unclassified Pseudoalteromonas]|uniref:hypothetical protein n=1 Tax=unclassified Pseudoalteromonas TaxID=194690 RepID=UPI000415A9F6|nr:MULTISPECIES: hypothetical protein [unclassified Pseudoalteromonas]MBH0050929.1 hypothetical protein [Pseudoalteromonas sp. SWYJZ19]
MNIYKKFIKSILIVITITLSACGSADNGAFSKQQICIATIASIMGRSPSIVKIDSIKGNVTHLSYVRKDDGTNWKYRCKFEGSRVIWASDAGRWRTDQYDSKITFLVDENELSIFEKYSDGSGNTKKYNINQLTN